MSIDSLTNENGEQFRYGYQDGKRGVWVKEADTDVFVPFKTFSLDNPILVEYLSKASANSSSYLNPENVNTYGNPYVNSEYFTVSTSGEMTANKSFTARFIGHFYNTTSYSCKFTVYKNDISIGELTLSAVKKSSSPYNMMDIKSNSFYSFEVSLVSGDIIKIYPSTWSGNYFGTGVYLVATEI